MRRFQHQPSRALRACLALALLFCTLFSVLSMLGVRDPVKGTIVTLSSPLTRVFDRAGEGAYNLLIGNRIRFADWEKQKNNYEMTLADLRRQLGELEQLQAENEQLRAYLGLAEQHSELALLDAELVYTGSADRSLITLDRGREDGVSVGMAVLDDYGLFGTVREVFATSCVVATLWEENSYVGTRIVRSGVSGTLCGKVDGTEYCLLQYMDANVDLDEQLKVGDTVLTSGYGGSYPKGLSVGRIVRVGVDPTSRAPYAYVDVNAAQRSSRTAGIYMIVLGENVLTPDAPLEGEESESNVPDGEMPSEEAPLDDWDDADEATEDGEVSEP